MSVWKEGGSVRIQHLADDGMLVHEIEEVRGSNRKAPPRLSIQCQLDLVDVLDAEPVDDPVNCILCLTGTMLSGS